MLHGVGPDGAALDAGRGGLEPGYSDRDGHQDNQGDSPNHNLVAAFLLFELWASDIHGLKNGNPKAKEEWPQPIGGRVDSSYRLVRQYTIVRP